jgi:peptide/nickel transport system permease protein
MSMASMRFLLRRLALFAAALVVISVLVFVALRILPGDVASVMAGHDSPPERVAALRMQLGLDRPLTQQYVDWAVALLHGNFGVSMLTGRTISEQVGARALVTFPLIVMGLIVALLIGIPLGCASCLAKSERVRGLFHLVAIISGSIPALWGGLLLILLLGKGIGLVGLFPSQGFPQDGWTAFPQAVASLALPALAVGIIVGAGLMRYTRAALEELMTSSTIDMAMACGMTRTRAMLTVGLRLAMPQLVSVIGLTFAEMITGVMVIENLFDLPGLGEGLITDVGNRDLIAVQGELFMLAAFFLTIGLAVDLLHRALDPRLNDSGGREL